MLELRPNCEHCGCDLPPESEEAMICSYECTYCKNCAIEVFKDVCPSCSGNFTPRPIRPKRQLEKHPASTVILHKPKDLNRANAKIEKYLLIKPSER